MTKSEGSTGEKYNAKTTLREIEQPAREKDRE